MCTKRNGAAGVRGHQIMNLSVPVVGTGLWASCEPLKRHVLNILHPYIPQNEWQFEFSPNRHLILTF
jgi:hypothetical protein